MWEKEPQQQHRTDIRNKPTLYITDKNENKKQKKNSLTRCAQTLTHSLVPSIHVHAHTAHSTRMNAHKISQETFKNAHINRFIRFMMLLQLNRNHITLLLNFVVAVVIVRHFYRSISIFSAFSFRFSWMDVCDCVRVWCVLPFCLSRTKLTSEQYYMYDEQRTHQYRHIQTKITNAEFVRKRTKYRKNVGNKKNIRRLN